MKNVIIVGASSGIGKSLAELYASKGFRVGITGRRKNLLDEIQATNPECFVVSVFDVNELKSDDHLNALVEKMGAVEVVIYSSGVGEFNKNLDFTIEKQMIDTNVMAFTQIADWAFQYFAKQGRGSFASITSMAGMMGSRHAPAYNECIKGLSDQLSKGTSAKSKKE